MNKQRSHEYSTSNLTFNYNSRKSESTAVSSGNEEGTLRNYYNSLYSEVRHPEGGDEVDFSCASSNKDERIYSELSSVLEPDGHHHDTGYHVPTETLMGGKTKNIEEIVIETNIDNDEDVIRNINIVQEDGESLQAEEA